MVRKHLVQTLTWTCSPPSSVNVVRCTLALNVRLVRLVADVATEGETLIADLALRHDDSSWEMKRHSLVDT